MSMPKIECSDVDKCCAAAALLQSIALEEAAISHILNAEGEKLQKIIATSSYSQKDLIEANKSVEDMVEKITALEMVLKAKLELIMPILERCEKDHKCDKCEKCKWPEKPEKPDKCEY